MSFPGNVDPRNQRGFMGFGLFQGVYINLDRRPDRRARMEREFTHFGLADRYSRIRAIPDANPALGCYRSHMKALEEARRIGGLVHILEDDSILSPQLAPYLENQVLALLARYDLLFLDMWVDQKHESIDQYQKAMDIGGGIISFRESRLRIAATSSYIVAPHRIGKLLRLLRWHLREGFAIDQAYDRLVRSDACSAAVVVPFLTGVDLVSGTTSDIQPISSRDQRMFVMLRTHFFIDRGRQPSL